MSVASDQTAGAVDVRVVQDPGEWDAVLARTRHDVFHTAGFQRYAATRDGGRPFLLVIDGGDRGLAWPYILRRIGAEFGADDGEAHDVGSFHGHTGPVTWGLATDDPFVGRSVDLVLEAWREQGAVSAFVRFHPLLDNAPSAADGVAAPDVISDIGETVSIDCTLDDDDARAGYARVLRQSIDRGRRAGLVTEHDPDWTGVEAFLRLHGGSMVRKGASDEYRIGAAGIGRMRRELGGRLHLFVTRRDDWVVGAGIFSEHAGYVEALMVGIDEAAGPWSPLKVMLDDVRRWGHRRGALSLHLGGGRAGRRDSLFDFKRRFSPRRHRLRIGSWVLDATRYGLLTKRRQRRLAQRGLVATQGWFPAYRAPARSVVPVVRERVVVPVMAERVEGAVR